MGELGFGSRVIWSLFVEFLLELLDGCSNSVLILRLF
jgi:hypothetical protein